MIHVKFSKGYLDRNQQQVVNAGVAELGNEGSAPAYEKERINWLVYESDERLIGALTADLLWDWIYIDELWVDADYRKRGTGKEMMSLAEDYAVANNLTGLWLWTQSWQAAKFYEQLGYEEFTRFGDFPKGHYRIGFRKQVS